MQSAVVDPSVQLPPDGHVGHVVTYGYAVRFGNGYPYADWLLSTCVVQARLSEFPQPYSQCFSCAASGEVYRPVGLLRAILRYRLRVTHLGGCVPHYSP